MMSEDKDAKLNEKKVRSKGFEYTVCPVCGSDKRRKLYRVVNNLTRVIEGLDCSKQDLREYANKTRIVRCIRCSHGYLYPRLSTAILKNYYKNDTSEYYGEWSLNSHEMFKKRYTKILSWIEKSIDRGRLLEIGCGMGDFLAILSERWDAYGVEPSDFATSQLQRRKIKAKVHHGIFEKDIYPTAYFDVVVMFDVLEHLPEPREVLSSIAWILRPGGIVVVQTGNMSSLTAKLLKGHWNYFSSVEHISFFSPKSLAYLLKSTGFANPKLWEITYDPSMKRSVKRQYYNIKSIVKTIISWKKNNLKLTGFHDHFVAISSRSDL
jgi:2-polyprenyl-3-methyl-5-hydroxy-6-metoxy-1,4-benzoquinol methylase